MIIGVRLANADETDVEIIITDAVKSSYACTVVEYGLRGAERAAIHDAGRATISISDLSQQRVRPSMVLKLQYRAGLSICR